MLYKVSCSVIYPCIRTRHL